MTNDAMVRGVFLAFVRVHILHHAAEGKVFGLEMIEELRRHGYGMSPGTLYPILHGLEEAGFLSSRSSVVDGKTRKYYRATAKGRRMLAEVREKIEELVEEVLEK
jgi:DNA-binding PadR family transcriptional regulator